jgi:hypothetical protein
MGQEYPPHGRPPEIAKLRERAETLRRLAKGVTNREDAEALVRLAAKMEASGSGLEAFASWPNLLTAARGNISDKPNCADSAPTKSPGDSASAGWSWPNASNS